MRQGKPNITMQKEAELCSANSTESRGHLKLLIGNQGHAEKE